MDLSKLIERAKNVLLTPKTEWPVIAGEPTTTADLYKNYVLILAAIPAVFSLIDSTVFGINVPFMGAIRIGLAAAISSAVLSYALALAGVFLLGLLINALAPTFGAEKNSIQALKTAVYAYTAAWLAGVGAIVPGLGFLIALAGGAYSIYLLYLGLPHTMKCTPEKAGGYTAVTVIAAIVLGWLAGLVVLGATGAGMALRGALPGVGSGVVLSDDVKVDPNSSLGKLEKWSKQVESAGKKMEAAEKSGDSKAAQDALGGVLGAVLGGGAQAVESLSAERIKAFLPETLAGLPRKSMSAERNQAIGMQISEAKARYGGGEGPDLSLEITDMGGARGMMAFAGWAALESEKQTDTGFEKTYRKDGRMVHEEWDNANNRGEYGIVLGERFMAKVSGSATSLDQLKAAVGSLNLAGLEALKNDGVKTAP